MAKLISIRLKLLCLILTLTILPLLTISIIFFQDAAESLKESAKTQYERDIENLVENIDITLQYRIEKVKSLKESDSLASFVLLGMQKYQLDNEVYLLQKTNGLKIDTSLPSVGDHVNFGILLGSEGGNKISDFGLFPSEEYVDATGTVRQHVSAGGSDDSDFENESDYEAISSKSDKLDRSNTTWFKKAFEEDIYISPPEPENIYLRKYNPSIIEAEQERIAIPKKLITIAMPYRSQGKIQGILRVTTDPDFLHTNISRFHPGTSHTYLVDNETTILAGNDSEEKEIMFNEKIKQLINDKNKGWSFYKGNLILFRKSNSKDWWVVSVISEENILGLVYALRGKTFIVITLSIIIVTIVIILFTQIFTKPILKVIGLLGEISAGYIQSLEKVDIKQNDEIGVLGNTFNTMLEKLKGVSQDIKQIFLNLNSTSMEIQSGAQEQTSGANIIASSVTQVSATLEELTITAKQITKNTGELVVASGDAMQSLEKGKTQLLKTVSQLEEVGSISKNNTTRIRELGKRSELINDMVDIIKEVANSTNMLSINASIEASRAGESGKGFSVVAAEIRELSKETINSTKKAEKAANEIGEFIKSIIISSEKESEKVIHSGKVTREFYDTIERIITLINNNYSFTQKIDISIKQQEHGSKEAAETMRQMAENSRQSAEIARQTSSAVKDIVLLGKELQKILRKFDVESTEEEQEISDKS